MRLQKLRYRMVQASRIKIKNSVESDLLNCVDFFPFLYRVSKKTEPFIFKLAANLLLEFVPMCTANMRWLMIEKESFIQISTIKMHFNSHMGLVCM